MKSKMTTRKKIWLMVLIIVGLAVMASSCEDEAVKEDREAAAASLNRLNDTQPVPEFRWSQIRQNLIDLTRAQAETTQTTSFFFNMGVEDPITVCPSIGFPIPTTAQLTNPLQKIRNRESVIAQVEQTGIYTGDSTGTYVICIDATGAAYAQYWEGFVATATGPAEWDKTEGQIKLIGPPSFDFSSGEGS